MIVLVAGLAWVASALGVAASDRSFEHALRSFLRPTEVAAARADKGRGGPDAVQAQYDAARDLEEALVAESPVSDRCAKRYGAALSYARAQVFEAEAYDRISSARIALGERRASEAAAALRRFSTPCTSVTRARRAQPERLDPTSNSVVLGKLQMVTRVPAGTTGTTVSVNGRVARVFHPRVLKLNFTVATRPGRYTIDVRHFAGSRLISKSVASQVWLLPSSARAVAPALTTNTTWERTLRSVGSTYNGYAGVWMQDLTTGASAGWNADARFPAASTVKLGVLVPALRRYGLSPESSRYGHDIRALGEWSSNLAANRLVGALGGSVSGSAVAEKTLHRLGATSSSYTGYYRVGTSARRRGDAPRQPPLVSRRVTTARDLGRILYVLHAGAMGDPTALHLLQLSKHEAQVGINVLLSSEPLGDNLGLVRPALDNSYPVAQKNGWISTARHTAAIIYTPHGPVIVVVLTYRGGGITRLEAADLAKKIIKLARP